MSIGRYSLLKNIEKTGSIKRSAKIIGVCEKTAHNYIGKMESRLGKKLVLSRKGGKYGGGSASLTKDGFALVKKFEMIKYREDKIK